MKKLLSIVLILLCVAGAAQLFAKDTPNEIVVQKVTGNVQYEFSAGKWKPLTAGMKIAPSTVINTGLNSSVVLKLDEQVVTVKAMQKGTAEKLIASSAVASSGIRMGASANDSGVSANSGPARTNISTASTRASDATEDVKWEE